MQDLKEKTKPTIRIKDSKPVIKNFYITVAVPISKPIIELKDKDINTYISFFSNHINNNIINSFQKQQYQKCIDILNEVKNNEGILTKIENVFVKNSDIVVEFTFSFNSIIKFMNFVTFIDKSVALNLI